MNVAIIGSGNMARAIGTHLLRGGHSVRFLNRQGSDAKALVDELASKAKGGAGVTSGLLGEQINEDVVVLAIPYAATAELAHDHAEQLKNKVVIDISNPVDYQTYELVTPAGSSAGQQTARLLPHSKIVKAFNTTFAPTLVASKVAGQPLDIFIAGDNEGAKNVVANLVKDGGLRPVDVGDLKYAHHIEAMMLVHMLSQPKLDTNFMSTIKIIS